MTKRVKGDGQNTRELLKRYHEGQLVIDYLQKSWLRHSAWSQAALIDWMILEGKHSILQIADSLIDRQVGSARKKEHKVLRVKGHIRHLQNDTQNNSQYPHCLQIKGNDTNDTTIMFDY